MLFGTEVVPQGILFGDGGRFVPITITATTMYNMARCIPLRKARTQFLSTSRGSLDFW